MSRKIRGKVRSIKKKVKKKPLPEVKNKEFWAILGILFLLSAMTILIMQENNVLTAGMATQTIAFVKAGTDLPFEIKNTEGLSNAIVSFNEDIKDAKIVFEEINQVSWPFDGRIYSMFKISSTDANKISKIKLNLKLSEEKIKTKLLQKEWITVYHNGEPLPTELISFKNAQAYYSATITEMGEYLIGFKAESEEPKIIVEDAMNEVIEEPVIETPEVIDPIKDVTTEEQPEEQQPTMVTEKGFFEKIGDWFRSLFN